jgi:hypothetical protein
MKTDPEEEITAPLREAFDALKQDESRAAPAYRAMVARAEAASRKSQVFPPWAALATGSAAAVALVWLGLALLIPPAAPGTALAEALPDFLAPTAPGENVSLFASLPESAGAASTDFLLPDHLTIKLF